MADTALRTLLLWHRDREPLTATAATGRNDLAAPGAGHARTETVLVETLSITRLISALHLRPPGHVPPESGLVNMLGRLVAVCGPVDSLPQHSITEDAAEGGRPWHGLVKRVKAFDPTWI